MRAFLALILICVFLASAFAESVDLISPADRYETYSKTISFQIFYNSSGSDYDIAYCDIVIDSIALAQASVSSMTSASSSISSLTVGSHSWESICDQLNSTTNATIIDSLSSSVWDFEILPTNARLEVISPATNHHSYNRANVFSFKYYPEDTGPSSPICYVEAGASRVAQASAIDDGQTDVVATLQYGTSAWRIRCTDGAGFELLSPTYSISVSSPPIASGGGSVSSPYKRNIPEPKAIEGPLTNPITDSSNLEDIKLQPQEPPEKAILTAVQKATAGDKVTLRALSAGGKPLTDAQIHIIDPQNNIIYITTDKEGVATFNAKMDGLYMYKMPEFELEFLPTTLVAQKPKEIPDSLTAAAMIDDSILNEPKSPKYEVGQPQQAADDSWIFFGAISAAFILASFFVLMRFSNENG